MRYICFILTILIGSPAASFMQEMSEPLINYDLLTGIYLGQTPPGSDPELFAPGIISTNEGWEAAISFSPDFQELFFTRRATIEGTENRIWYTRKIDGKWIEPKLAPFAKEYMEFEAFITPGGNKIIFSSDRPKPDGITYKGDIWYSEKTGSGWGEPKYLSKEINDGWAMFVTSTIDGTLYFTGGYNKKYGIFISKLVDGKYSEPEYLPEEINQSKYFGASHPYIAPDESYLIFDAQPDGPAKTDLYISFRKLDGSWTKAVKFDTRINATKTEGIPSVSPDGKYLFFHRKNDVYWVSTSIFDELKSQNLK